MKLLIHHGQVESSLFYENLSSAKFKFIDEKVIYWQKRPFYIYVNLLQTNTDFSLNNFASRNVII